MRTSFIVCINGHRYGQHHVFRSRALDRHRTVGVYTAVLHLGSPVLQSFLHNPSLLHLGRRWKLPARPALRHRRSYIGTAYKAKEDRPDQARVQAGLSSRA